MSIRKRVRCRPDGTEYLRFEADAGKGRHGGKRARAEFRTRREALAFIDKARKEQNDGPDSETTVRELGDAYAENRKAAGRVPGTYEKYREHFKNHICAVKLSAGDLKGLTIADIRVSALRLRHLSQFKEDLYRSASSHSMAKRVWATFTWALDYAVSKEWVPANLAYSVDIKFKAPEKREVEIPTQSELADIFDAIKWQPGNPVYFVQAYVHLGLTTGLRPGEQRALRWANLKIDEAPFHVKVVEALDDKNVLGPPKTSAGRREVALPASTAALLRAWRSYCPKNAKDLVFPTLAGGYFSLSNLDSRVWKRLQVAIGLVELRQNKHGKLVKRGRYRLYSIRHTYASLQIEIGVKPKLLQKRMGHKSVRFTLDTYVKLWENKYRDAEDADKMDAWIAAL
jgi:integrase